MEERTEGGAVLVDGDREPRADRRSLLGVSGVVLAFAVYVTVRYLPRGRLGAGFDRVAYTAPNHAAAFEAIRHLRLPQWNPYLFGGSPLLANPQVGAFYPLNYVFAWMQPQRGVTALLGLHVAILGLGAVFLLGVVMRLRPAAVLVGSIGLMGSGVVLAQLPHFEQVTTIAWVGWFLGLVDLLLEGRIRRSVGVAALGVVVAMMLLCGHQQPAYYLLLLGGAWTVGRLLDDHRGLREALCVLGGVVAGIALAAVQLLPTAELVSRSIRSGGLTLAVVDVPEFTLEAKQVVVTALGDPLSSVMPVGSEMYGAIGIGLAFLALCGVIGRVSGRHRWHTTFVALAGIGGLVLAMGANTPLYRLAFGVVPGLDLLRVPGRAILIFDVAAVILAAIGLEELLGGGGRRTARLAACVMAAAGVVALVLPITLVGGRAVLVWAVVGGTTVAAATVATSGTGPGARLAVIALIAVPLLEPTIAAFQPAPAGPLPSTDATGKLATFLRHEGGRALIAGIDDLGNQAYLRTSLRPNVNATEDVRSLDGYDGGASLTKRWIQAMEAITGRTFNPELTLKAQLPASVSPALAARYGVRWFGLDSRVSDAAVTLPGWRGPVVSDGPLRLYENPAFRSEALVYRTVRADDGRPLYEQQAPGAAPASSVVVEGTAGRSCAGACEPTPVELDRPSPERLVVDVAGRPPGMLVVAEGWDPGWRARVDGRSRKIRPALRNFLAVETRAGDREIVLTYRAPGLRIGALVSTVVTLALLAAIAFEALRDRRRRALAPTSAMG